jgi:hypothetical protein
MFLVLHFVSMVLVHIVPQEDIPIRMMLRLVLLVPLEPTVDLVRPVVPLVLQEHIKHPQEHPHAHHVQPELTLPVPVRHHALLAPPAILQLDRLLVELNVRLVLIYHRERELAILVPLEVILHLQILSLLVLCAQLVRTKIRLAQQSVPHVMQEDMRVLQEQPLAQHVVLVLIAVPQAQPRVHSAVQVTHRYILLQHITVLKHLPHHVLHVPLDDILHLLDPQVALLVVVEPITL